MTQIESAPLEEIFRFKEFSVRQTHCSMKVGTDSVLLGAWIDVSGAQHMMDIGTGTGVIALMLAQRHPKAQIHAIEINKSSAREAQYNIEQSPWSDRIQMTNAPIQSLLEDKSQLKRYNRIVCNPPFFSGGTLSKNMEKNEVRHTIKLPHQDLLRCSQKFLSRNGTLSVILPFKEGLKFIELARSYGFELIRQTDVKARPSKAVERVLLELIYLPSDTKEYIHSELVIRENEGQNKWTVDYLDLVKDFYLFA